MESNKNIVILGAGESGVGAAYLAQQQGYNVFVSDFGAIAEHYKKQLTGWNIRFEEKNSKLLNDFSKWLSKNYSYNWALTNLVKRGTGIHNGRLHRSLSQIQVKLFEEKSGGLNNIISTSSIIEGVNTSAENVILWMNKNGRSGLNDFTYRNIITLQSVTFQF